MATLSQRSFSGGEIAPALYARVDTAKYAYGLRTCRNAYVMKHGGAANRPGTEFVGEIADPTEKGRLIPFIFNSDQTYDLEFSGGFMRVIKDGEYITDDTEVIVDATNTNPVVIELDSGTGYDTREVYIDGIVGMTELNGRYFRLEEGIDSDHFELYHLDGTAVDGTGFGVWSSGGTVERFLRVTIPYTEADLPDLQFVQSADILMLAHPSYAPRQIARASETSWSIATMTFQPSISAPTNVAVSGTAGTTARWRVTAVKAETFEESYASSIVGANSEPTTGAPRTISWTAVSGAAEYNVYREQNGIFGFIGIAGSNSFVDTGYEIDTKDTPPQARTIFNSTNNYPSTIGFFQQSLMFANTNTTPEQVWKSKTGQFKNFTISVPLQDDDSVTFTIAGRQVNPVKHLVDLKKLVLLTSAGEWVINGDANGAVVPGEINPEQHSYYGSSEIRPIVIGGTALYVQARGSIVRDLGFSFQDDGYTGNDLTIFSNHLFENHTIVDWDFQQNPHSIVWAVRDDGVLLGLTYLRDHQILAWHRHDTDGFVENVSVIPEGVEDSVYIIVRRVINGKTVRYVERMKTRVVDDIVDSVFLDSSITVDGRNDDDSHTMTLSGGTNWTHEETLTLTSSESYFAATDVGNQMQLTGSDGTLIRFSIDAYTSATVVTGKAHKIVPAGMRSAAISTWTKAVSEVTGLWHLEGKDVAIFADGFVVANPNNDSYDVVTVEDGSITLDKPYGVIHVGLPYTTDIETLDIDTPDGETLVDKKKHISKVTLSVEKSRGIWVGARPPTDDTVDPLEGLNEIKVRNNEGYDSPVDLKTEAIEVNIKAEWNSNGRVFIRQVDPLPLSVLAVSPAGLIPMRR